MRHSNAYAETSRPIAGALVLFVCLSTANSFGGIAQAIVFGCCIVVASAHRLSFPLRTLVSVAFCGTLATLSSLLHRFDAAYLVLFLRPFIEGYLTAIVLYALCGIRNSQSLQLALAGFVALQGLFAILMVSNPDLRLALLSTWYADETYQSPSILGALQYRGFGVSRHHLFGFPLALGAIVALLIINEAFLAKYSSRLYILLICTLGILLIAGNARIGFIPIIFLFVLGGTLYFRTFLKRILTCIFILLFLAFLLRISFPQIALPLTNWLKAGVFQFFESSSMNKPTTMSDLRGMIFFPNSILEWLFGEGRVAHWGEGRYSDIGWVRLLQQGGVVLISAVLYTYLRIIRNIHNALFSHTSTFCTWKTIGLKHLSLWVFLLTFGFAGLKGDAFASNDYSRLLMTLAVLAHFQNVEFMKQKRIVRCGAI